MAIASCFMDKQTMREIGMELWKLRKKRGMYLKTVAYQTNIPERIIEGMEIGKFLQFSTFRRLIEFYGAKMNIKIE